MYLGVLRIRWNRMTVCHTDKTRINVVPEVLMKARDSLSVSFGIIDRVARK